MNPIIYPDPTPEVLAIGKLNFQGVGHIQIPDTWWERLRTPAGKTDTNGCIILAEIVFRYRPANWDDENGKVKTGKWFKADLLQKSYKQLSDKFGLTLDQVKRAVGRLEEGGYICRVLRDEDGYINRMYIQIFPSAIEQLTFGNANLQPPSPQKCKEVPRKFAATLPANLLDIQIIQDKEDLTKNIINNSFVETSSTSFERENLEDDPSKWEWVNENEDRPQFLRSQIAYLKSNIPTGHPVMEPATLERIKMLESELAATSYGEILKVENETNAINAADSTIENEAIQATNKTKKTAPQPLKSERGTAPVNTSNSKNEVNAQTTQPRPPKLEINECLQHDSSESVLYCEVELVEERKAKKPKGPAPTEFDVQVNDSLCQLFESWGYKTFKRDANQIRLMRTEDKRGENEIVFLLDYLQKFGDADKKLRWVEIRSPKSFRDKADSLIAEIKRNKANENRNQPQYAPDPNICPF